MTSVFINELHYDNYGTDTGEAIEIAGPAGTDLNGWSIELYNGSSGRNYNTINLSGTIPDRDNGFGTIHYPITSIQNGSPDGLALVNNNDVVQFLSYEGSLTAISGTANGQTSTDIGVSESSTTVVGFSLQLTGMGTDSEDFTWNEPADDSFGSVNEGQSFSSNGSTNSNIVGTTDRDTLQGTAAAEKIDGGEDNDILTGSLGADSLIGGEGIDRVVYGNSTAAVTVDLLNNTATGGDADGDTFDLIENLDGSRFSDVLRGDDNDNRIYGAKGDDTLSGNDGADYLNGQNGDDALSGGAGKDRLLGGNGNDTLSGGIDNDILSGGNGADSITGADADASGVGEIDRLVGAGGADTFVLGTSTSAFYNDGDTTTDGITDYALITDFDASEDVIELSSAGTYYLDVNPYGTSAGTGIYLDDDGTNDELVGLLKGVELTAGAIDGNTQGFSLVQLSLLQH